MAANEAVLGLLHDLTATALIAKLKGTPVLDEGGEPTGEVIPCSAADIQAAAKFLKDNNITCSPADDNKLGELEQKLKDRQKRRASRLTPQDMEDAREQSNFMQGLPN